MEQKTALDMMMNVIRLEDMSAKLNICYGNYDNINWTMFNVKDGKGKYFQLILIFTFLLDLLTILTKRDWKILIQLK